MELSTVADNQEKIVSACKFQIQRAPLTILIQSQLSPPFQKENELLTIKPVFSPFHSKKGFDPKRPMKEIISEDVSTVFIDKIYSHLWLAGPPKAARPLHRQKLLGRALVMTENCNEHLVWHPTRMLIKPLPEYLLNYDFWMTEGNFLLEDQTLFQNACGLLLSYCWLVCNKSDLVIAHDTRLLPSTITWEKWVVFVTDVLTNIDSESLKQVSPRYHFGELRLSRLNMIYRVAPVVFSPHNLVRGFISEASSSKAFLEANFAWLFSVFGFVTIVGSSMQVGVGTDFLNGSSGFQGASVVFTVGSLLVAAGSVVFVALVWGFLFFYHVLWARTNLQKVQRVRSSRVEPG